MIAVTGLALTGPQVGAQLPELPPLTLPPPDPATTTSTLLPPLLPPDLLPAPTEGTAPPGVLPLPLPLPTTAPARRTAPYRPPPVPPSTPVRAARSDARVRPAATSSTIPADQVEGAELGEPDTGFASELPFDGEEGGDIPLGIDTVELGAEASAGDEVGTLASVAAGLIAMVLLGLALWLRGEARRPAALPPW